MSSSFPGTRAIVVALVALAAAFAGAHGFLAARAEDQTPASPEPADLVLLGGRIVTLDEHRPETQALAALNGLIVAVGTNEQIEPHIGPTTRVIRLEGKLAVPGFIEGHGHFTGIGRDQLIVDLMTTRTWDAIVSRVAAAVRETEPGAWVFGRGWHQEKWERTPQPSVQGFPTHHQLSEISPDNPVILTHASGHASFVNEKAMELSGITKDTPNPFGGEIVRGSDGEPTGVLLERAQDLARVGASAPEPTEAGRLAKTRHIVELADREVLSKGITSFQDAGSSFDDVDLFKQMVDEGSLGVRLWVMLRVLPGEAPRLPHYRMVNYGNHMLTVRALKVAIDGALGTRGAWLLAPYADKPDDTGQNTTSPEVVRELATICLEQDFQLCVHAIGDRGNRETLDVFEAAFKTRPEKKDRRWRIEHAQHLSEADIPRFGQLGVIASMQAVHCTSDAPWVLARLGAARAEEGAYVWQKLMRTGTVVTNGTDAPVEDVNPIANFYAAVSRRLANGEVFYPDQRMSRLEALRSYTILNAHAAFEESLKGSLIAGKLADITVLSKDILLVPEAEIRDARVLYTIVGGRVRYEAGPKSR